MNNDLVAIAALIGMAGGAFLIFKSYAGVGGVNYESNALFNYETRHLDSSAKAAYKILIERHYIGSYAVAFLTTISFFIGIYGYAISQDEISFQPSRSSFLLVILLSISHLGLFKYIWAKSMRQVRQSLKIDRKGFVRPTDPRSAEQKRLANLGMVIVFVLAALLCFDV